MRAETWERVLFVRDYQHEIAKMTDQRGQKRKQSTLDLFCQGKRKPKETTLSEGMYPPLKKCPRNEILIRQQIDQKKTFKGKMIKYDKYDNHSFNLFVSFSTFGLKENIKSLIYYSFGEET